MGDDSGLSRRRLLAVGAAAVAAAGGAMLALPKAGAVTLSGIKGTVNTDSLSVRSGPTTSYSRIGLLAFGQTVTCLETSGTWFKIQRPEITGWVASRYIKLTPVVTTKTLDRGRTDLKMVALTFDCGADRGYAASILDTLAAKGVKASFGITGRWLDANPDLAHRIGQAGHQLINHTLRHYSLTGVTTPDEALVTPAQHVSELVATEQRFAKYAGRRAKPWFRPPYGDYDALVLRDLGAAGFAYNVMWTVDSLGWDGLSRQGIV